MTHSKLSRNMHQCEKCHNVRIIGPEGLCHECWQAEKDEERERIEREESNTNSTEPQ